MDSIGKILLLVGAIGLFISAALSLGTLIFFISAVLLVIGGVLMLEDTEFGGWLFHGLIMVALGCVVSCFMLWIVGACC